MNAELAEMIDALEPLERARWDALAEGKVQFQQCNACGNAWLPARAECPSCLAADWAWETASGRGELRSWVVYQRAFSPAFKDQVPYAIAQVQLAEGPLMITRMEAVSNGLTPECGDPVQISVVEIDGVNFANADPAGD
jgi:uncharacterized protein